MNDTLILENDVIRHKFLGKSGDLHLVSMVNKTTSLNLTFSELIKNLFLMGEKESQYDSIAFGYQKPFGLEEGFVHVDYFSNYGNVKVKTQFKIYKESPAISATLYFKGKALSEKWEIDKRLGEREMIETALQQGEESSRMMAIPLESAHWRFKIVSFKEATDYHDDPVQEKWIFQYRQAQGFSGNLLIGENIAENHSFFLLKESPIAYSQSIYPGFDFRFDNSQLTLHGLGVGPDELVETEWIRAYGYAIGLCGIDDFSQKETILSYQKKLRKFIPERDAMVLANTWGDRSKDSRMNEQFILNEIEIAAELGITHLQLDDGWQKGLSRNSASKEGKIWDDWNTEDWQPHPDRFPNGFEPIIQKAKSKGIEICLWFNPSKVNSYALWERDADVLICYYQKFGIRVFKIDGMSLSDKSSEINLRKMFEKVQDATKGMAVFNLDVTAGNRIGYHYFQEYGNIFLENRYTDWGNYFPYRTLSNVWKLAAYTPSQRLQVEFLNVVRNQHKYRKDDRLSPFSSGQAYATSISMLGQPLAWMELSGLNINKQEVSDVIGGFSKYKDLFNGALIIPIGNPPNGYSIASFMIKAKNGDQFMLLYLELVNENSTLQRLELPNVINGFTHLFGENPENIRISDHGKSLEINHLASNQVYLLRLN